MKAGRCEVGRSDDVAGDPFTGRPELREVFERFRSGPRTDLDLLLALEEAAHVGAVEQLGAAQ